MRNVAYPDYGTKGYRSTAVYRNFVLVSLYNKAYGCSCFLTLAVLSQLIYYSFFSASAFVTGSLSSS